jgi:hypothetical protein
VAPSARRRAGRTLSAPAVRALASAVAATVGSVMLAYTGAAPAAQDFDARKSAPGVVRWFDFDTAAQLGSRVPGARVGRAAGDKAAPVIDTSIKASGAGSLRFDVNSLSGSDAAGYWYANFADDLSVQFGENTEFFIQWRQRFSKAFIDTYFTETHSDGTVHPQVGIKQVIVTTGDQPGRTYASCEAIEVVVSTYYQHRFPIGYNSCTGSASHGPYEGFYERAGAADFLLQNGTSPYCLYSAPSGDGTRTGVGPGCFGWVADEWMTFQVAVTLGARDDASREFRDSRFRLWGAREGRPSVLLIDWKPGLRGYFPLTAGPAAENQRFGKIYLLPYMTNKDKRQVHDLVQTWYDELIISTRRIPDPAPAQAPAPNAAK